MYVVVLLTGCTVVHAPC